MIPIQEKHKNRDKNMQRHEFKGQFCRLITLVGFGGEWATQNEANCAVQRSFFLLYVVCIWLKLTICKNVRPDLC